MTWGPYWWFFQCSACGKKFKHTDDIEDKLFRKCPACGGEGELRGESNNVPKDADAYETV